MKKNKARLFGFVLIAILLWGTRAFSAAPLKLKVSAELANVRLKPSISSVIIMQIPAGEILEAVRKEGEWYLIKLSPDESGSAVGYVHESLVLALDGTPITERKPQLVDPSAKKEGEQPQKTESFGPETLATEAGKEAPSTSSWAVTLSAGGNYALGGDINKGAQGFADFYGTKSGVAGDVEVAQPHLSFIFGGEITIALSSYFYVSAGADFFSNSKTSLVSYAKTGFTDTFTTKPNFQAVPLKLSLTFFPAGSLYLKLGLAYYFAKCGYYYRYEQENYWQEIQGEATAGGFGFWGGLGYEWAFSENVSLIIEAMEQYAPIKGFEGTGTSRSSLSPDPITEEGKLYAYDYQLLSRVISPLLLIRSKDPSSDAYVKNAREATLDFSGIALRAGIKIKF